MADLDRAQLEDALVAADAARDETALRLRLAQEHVDRCAQDVQRSLATVAAAEEALVEAQAAEQDAASRYDAADAIADAAELELADLKAKHTAAHAQAVKARLKEKGR